MEKLIKEIVDTGVNTIVIGGSISELANHYFEKYGILFFLIMNRIDGCQIHVEVRSQKTMQMYRCPWDG
jgi:chaperonin GroEL (HSP60 family)